MRVDDPGHRDPAARQLLDDHRVGREIEAHPAVLLGDGHAEQPELLHLLDHRRRGTCPRGRSSSAIGRTSLSTNCRTISVMAFCSSVLSVYGLVATAIQADPVSLTRESTSDRGPARRADRGLPAGVVAASAGGPGSYGAAGLREHRVRPIRGSTGAALSWRCAPTIAPARSDPRRPPLRCPVLRAWPLGPSMVWDGDRRSMIPSRPSRVLDDDSSTTPLRRSRHGAVRTELGGQLPPASVDARRAPLGAAYVVVAQRRPDPADLRSRRSRAGPCAAPPPTWCRQERAAARRRAGRSPRPARRRRARSPAAGRRAAATPASRHGDVDALRTARRIAATGVPSTARLVEGV